ncbi:MAG: AbrB/MazE/SpoVT family DNA-binding domain-containing protein [Candidatus Nanoarchaeia archaeon]
MNEFTGKTPEGVEYKYFRCNACKSEILDMSQLQAVAKSYRELKKFDAKLSKWGTSIGVRIPKELVKKYNLKGDSKVSLIPEKEGIRIVLM